jgi:alcohol dehydrogenase
VKAVIYDRFQGPLKIETVADPSPARDGVVIRVRANGICRSDWHGWMGHDPDIRLPHVPGHELAGVVEAVGSGVNRWQTGDRVTVPFAIGCGACAQCVSGNQHICDLYYQPGFTGWGSFAQFVAIPFADANLVSLPDELDPVAAASLGCRFATAFRALVAQGRVGPGQWLAVHGCGGVGLAAVMIGRALGAQVIGVDVSLAALEWAKSLGAAHVLQSRGVKDVGAAVRELSGGGAHVAVDAFGSPETCRNSILSLRKRGRHVQVGLLLAEHRDVLLPMSAVIAMELELYGSHGMQAHAYRPMLELIRARQLDPMRLVRKTVSLSQAPAELAAMGAVSGPGITVINEFWEFTRNGAPPADPPSPHDKPE